MKSVPEITQSILDKIEGVRNVSGGYQFKCPVHDDKVASATLYINKDHVNLVCHVGCERQAICSAIGISESDLYVNQSKPSRQKKSPFKILAEYVYEDAQGNPLFEKLRMEQFAPEDPKCLYRRLIDGTYLWGKRGGWFEKKKNKWERLPMVANEQGNQPSPNARWFDDCPRVLYRMQKLKLVHPGAVIHYHEGEKDVETAEWLGFLATTAGGATDWREEFAENLRGLDVLIYPDNDTAGRKHAAKVAADCHGKAARIRIVELLGLPEKGDLSDWIQAGGTREQLLEIIEAAKDYQPPQPAVTPDTYQPIAADKDRDDRLWLLPSSASKVLDAIDLIFKALGIIGDHTRLINALLMVGHKNGKYQRGTILAAHQWLADKYPKDGGKSVDTVRRDIRNLRHAQTKQGVDLLGYTKGSMNRSTGEAFASKFSRPFLRYALEAIYVAAENQNLILPDEIEKLTHKALKEACMFIASMIPRTVATSGLKAKSQKQKTAEDWQAEIGRSRDGFIQQAINENWSTDEVKAELRRLLIEGDDLVEIIFSDYQKGQKTAEPIVCNHAHYRDSDSEEVLIQ